MAKDTASRPIFGLLAKISDDKVRSLALTLFQHLNVENVDQLARYSSKQLKRQEVPDAVMRELERVLTTDYHMAFSQTDYVPQSSRPSSPASRQTQPSRASGAAPRSSYDDMQYSLGRVNY